MYLMNGDRPVLWFDFAEQIIHVIDNDYLPLSLKDYVKTSDFSSMENIRQNYSGITALKDFLISRLLSFSKSEAKAILNSVNFPQSNKTDDKVSIALSCQSLSMVDNFWTKEDDDVRTFAEVNLRNHKLKDAAYAISLLGRTLSATKEIMLPDIMSGGTFPKTWYRGETSIELWKTDRTTDQLNTQCELRASDILDQSNVEHVSYRSYRRDGILISVCDCIANDRYAVVDGFFVKDYCDHHQMDFLEFMEELDLEAFAKMCVSDYVLANTDRHIGNIHFIVDNETNQIVGFAPQMDHNLALVADYTGTDISDLVYDATKRTMLESAIEYYPVSNIVFECLPESCQRRLDCVINHVEEIEEDVLNREDNSDRGEDN